MTLALAGFPNLDSVIRRLDPRLKLFCFLTAAILVVFLKSLVGVAIALTFGLCLLALARLPWIWSFRQLSPLLAFLLLLIITSPWFLALDVHRSGGTALTFSMTGLERGLMVSGKALTLAVMALVLMAASPLDGTLTAAQALWIPGLLVQLALLTLRYISVFGREWVRLATTLRARGFRNRFRSHSFVTVGHVIGTLLVRGNERAERVGQAMRCRGYDGYLRTMHEYQLGLRDGAALAIFLILGIGLLVCDRLYFS